MSSVAGDKATSVGEYAATSSLSCSCDAQTGCSFESILAQNGFLTYRIAGVSMMPMVRQFQDAVTIETIERCRGKGARAQVGDVVMFKRAGGTYVLHRVVRVTEAGYITRGDNCAYADAPITPDQLLGIMTRFTRGKKEHRENDRLARAFAAAAPVHRAFARARQTVRCAVSAAKSRLKRI